MIIAFAGRRIDDPNDSVRRFPMENIEDVRRQLNTYLTENKVKFLIASAACGGDLLALDLSQAMNISTTIILPFGISTFKKVSVTDRPGDWGLIFDKIISNTKLNKVINLALTKDDAQAYQKVNSMILSETRQLGKTMKMPIRVLTAWDGEKKASNDITWLFIDEAKKQNLQVDFIKTNTE